MNDMYLKLARNQYLDTERLYLRPITLSDTEDMYEYASDEQTTKYVFERHKSLKDTQNNIARFFLAEPLGKYAIVLKKKSKMIGTIDIHNLDCKMRTGEIGYTINKEYWNHGYATEAAAKLLEVAFEKLEFNRVTIYHDSENDRSGEVARRIGMRKVLEMPYARFKGDRAVTDVMYCLTKEEYFQEDQADEYEEVVEDVTFDIS